MGKHDAKAHGWSEAQVRQFARDLRKSVGDGWAWMTPAVQRALVAERVLDIVRGQHRDTIEIMAIDGLLVDMLAACGLEGA